MTSPALRVVNARTLEVALKEKEPRLEPPSLTWRQELLHIVRHLDIIAHALGKHT